MAGWFPQLVYFLCFITSAVCAWLLMRGFRRSGAAILFWSGLCFLLLAANNLVVIVDLLVLPDFDLGAVRILLSLTAVATLLFGLIWRLEERP
jgi:hypothetical protein